MTDQSTAETNNQPEHEHSGLYWFFFNLRKRVFGGIWNFSKRRPVLGILFFLLLIWTVVTGRGWYQPGFLFVRKYFVLTVIVLFVLFLVYRLFVTSKIPGKALSVVLLLGLGALVWLYGAPMTRYVALFYHYNSIQKVELAQLPITGHERIQPLNSVLTLARQEALDETESAELPHFIRRSNGRFDFTMGVGPHPNYPFQRLTRNMYEVLAVDGNAPAPDFSAESRHVVNFDVGENLLFSKRTYSAAVKRFDLFKFFNYQPDEVRFIDNGKGEWKQVVSMVRWKGILFPRPVFGGVLVIDEKEKGAEAVFRRIILGEGNWIHPGEIHKYPWLDGQNLVPESVARFTAESFRFHEGFLAPFPGYHEGDIRIPDLPADQNEMPFVTWFDFTGTHPKAEAALYNYFGLEPFQEDKRGLNMSLFIAGDGDPTVYYYDHAAMQSGLTGSSAVPIKVKESRKNYDWNTNIPVESRPYIRDIGGERRFFWLTTVVTKSDKDGVEFIGGSIPDVTLTDALKKQVVWIDQRILPNSSLWDKQLLDELGVYWGIATEEPELPELQSEEVIPIELSPGDLTPDDSEPPLDL